MPHGLRSTRANDTQLAEFADHLQRIRERERAHLAQELHDELGAILFAAKLDVACLGTLFAGESPEIARRLKHLGATLNLGIALKRRVVEGLSPSSLTNLGLAASLEILATDFALTSGIEIARDLEQVSLDDWTELVVYRLVQESLTNMAKYANAGKASIVLAIRQGMTVVEVLDDGIGFDVERVGSGHYGLAGIRHRVETCGGCLNVASAPGKGTRIEASLPNLSGAIKGEATSARHGLHGRGSFTPKLYVA